MPNGEHPSPSYTVGQQNDGLYAFRTVNRILYVVRFKPSGYIFEHDPILQPFVYEISIVVLDNPMTRRPPADPLVASTVALIFGQFFYQHERIVVYICDASDQRGQIRHRKFTGWFERLTCTDYVHLSGEVMFTNIKYEVRVLY